ncbi:hypothetical protein N8I77_007490 [Diaporthe amygdali]|uniref:Uncharacterized protein n=1 Tax=Phomopsis amygdali TaxID=1214568 RepID=A0AAD9SDC2_PHOAM|nr:hypothetical protein N8I77_007490 [Diaporthe amygdali]
MAMLTSSVTVFAHIIGALLISTGIWGMRDASAIAPHFGIPDATKEMLFMWPAAAGRNIAAGLAVLILSFDGQRRALGILIMCWSLVGFADISILVSYSGSENKAFTFGLVFWLFLTGLGLVYT